jgi:hypothetical protein
MAELTNVEVPSMANAQGNAYVAARQQGGQAPVGDQGLLESGLRASAGVDSLDAAATEIKGMQDGGRRRKNRSAKRKGRKASRKGRKGSRKGRKNRSASRKGRKSTRRSRQQGGAFGDAAQEVSAPGELLPADMQKAALSSQSADWKGFMPK